jgi:beta-glucosidase
MMLVDDDGRARLEPGWFRLTVGGCSPGARGRVLGAAESLTGVIEVVP